MLRLLISINYHQFSSINATSPPPWWPAEWAASHWERIIQTENKACSQKLAHSYPKIIAHVELKCTILPVAQNNPSLSVQAFAFYQLLCNSRPKNQRPPIFLPFMIFLHGSKKQQWYSKRNTCVMTFAMTRAPSTIGLVDRPLTGYWEALVLSRHQNLKHSQVLHHFSKSQTMRWNSETPISIVIRFAQYSCGYFEWLNFSESLALQKLKILFNHHLAHFSVLLDQHCSVYLFSFNLLSRHFLLRELRLWTKSLEHYGSRLSIRIFKLFIHLISCLI